MTTTSVNLTSLESAVLYAIAHHEMNPGNGARPKDHRDVATWSWADDFARDATRRGTPMNTATAKAVMGTLTQKGLLACDGRGRDAVVSFTPAGFTAFAEKFPQSDS